MKAQIEKAFVYYPPTVQQVAVYEALRHEARIFAERLERVVPPSRELSLAITKLEEVIMWANAGIARNNGPNT